MICTRWGAQVRIEARYGLSPEVVRARVATGVVRYYTACELQATGGQEELEAALQDTPLEAITEEALAAAGAQ